MELPTASASALTGLNILVVEDEPLLAFDYVDELEDRGARPVVAFTAAEAVAAVQLGLPDLAILDVNLGTETSWLVAEMLSSNQVPFVMVTGFATEANVPSGVVPADCLEKPVGAQAVADRLVALIA